MLEIQLTSKNDSGEVGTNDFLKFDMNAAKSAASFFDTLVKNDLANSPLSTITLSASEAPQGVLLSLLSKVKETDASELSLSGFETIESQEFIKALELLAGSRIERLHLCKIDFSNYSDDQLVSLFKSFEIAAISCLALGSIGLNKRTPEGLAKIFEPLSESKIQSLQIMGLEFSLEQLNTIFSSFKKGPVSSLHFVTDSPGASHFEQSVFLNLRDSTIRYLNLSSRHLNDVNLDALFSDLSDSGITTLDFSNYDLSNADRRKKFIEAIERTHLKGIKTLVLRDTNIYKLSGEELSAFFQSFKNTTISDLDVGVSRSNMAIACVNLNQGLSGLMGVSNLHSLHLRIDPCEREVSFISAFTRLEFGIKHLDLSNSKLENFYASVLAEAFSILGRNNQLTSINLAGCFFSKSVYKIIGLIKALKNSAVYSLDLSYCAIDYSKESLISLFESLIDTKIEHVIFCYNRLGLFPLADLKEILNSVPSNIQIDISHNNLFHRERSMADRDSLLQILATMNEPIYSHNGESDFARAVLAVLPAIHKGDIPRKIASKILFFLAPKPDVVEHTMQKIERNLLMNKTKYIDAVIANEVKQPRDSQEGGNQLNESIVKTLTIS